MRTKATSLLGDAARERERERERERRAALQQEGIGIYYYHSFHARMSDRLSRSSTTTQTVVTGRDLITLSSVSQ